MARIKREEVINEALKLLDETGLDGVSTRRVAQRLGVESASLYWHFKNKAELLNEMSAAVLARFHLHSPPESVADWPDFVRNNARSFRNALLAHRDGARLHAGSQPTAAELEPILDKVGYLVRAGFTEYEAGMALYTTSQFTIGCVLEEQARLSQDEAQVSAIEAFEFGLNLLVLGLKTQPGLSN